MATYLVLTVIGDDRPGLVEQLANTVAANSGNWLESSMSQLAGKFAGILKISVPDNNADKLVSDLQASSNNLKLVIEKVNDIGEVDQHQIINLNLVGNDRPGIVKEISAALASQGVNVEELNTHCSPAPMSGEMLFTVKSRLRVPAGLDMEALKNGLEEIADDLIVDINIDQ